MIYYFFSAAIIHAFIAFELATNWETVSLITDSGHEPPWLKWVACSLWPIMYIYVGGLLLWDRRK